MSLKRSSLKMSSMDQENTVSVKGSGLVFFLLEPSIIFSSLTRRNLLFLSAFFNTKPMIMKRFTENPLVRQKPTSLWRRKRNDFEKDENFEQRKERSLRIYNRTISACIVTKQEIYIGKPFWLKVLITTRKEFHQKVNSNSKGFCLQVKFF